jgi:putative drug exporter of the RND superfamily
MTSLATLDTAASSAMRRRSSPLSRLSRWCFHHRGRVVLGWLAALVVLVGISTAMGSRFDADFNLPRTDSQAAVSLLANNFPAVSGEGDQIVIRVTKGTVRTPAVRNAVTDMLAKVATLPDVAGVGSPYRTTGAAQISRDGSVAFATVTLNRQTGAVTESDAQKLVATAVSADGAGVHISLAGQSIANSEAAGTGLSIGVGVVAALVILLLVFGGALFASMMPLATAALALIVATSVIGLLSHLFNIPSLATDLSVLIGLGVGVDYGLFIISRHRSAVKAGAGYEDAAAQAVETSGRTVLFAGITVCIALLGQLTLGVAFLNGMSISAAIAVALTMGTSLTFLPAMLGFLGPKALSRRERRTLAEGTMVSTEAKGFWLRWGRFVERRSLLAALGALVVVVLAASPIFGLQLGSSDAGTDPSGSTTHQAYTALAKGFGPGFNGPLELAARIGSQADVAAFDRLLSAAADNPGVASVTPALFSPNGKAAIATLYPTTSPQASQTVRLVNELRSRVIPEAEQGNTLSVHVGGLTATNIDFSHVLTEKLPLFIAVVVLLAFLLLLIVFRSLLIPLVASIMNLLSIGAALGALNAAFHWGWGNSLLHLSGTGPIDAFLPVLMFSVLFGLSMDYEVYLISRMQEEWRYGVTGTALTPREKDRRNHLAVTVGQAKSGRVVAAAAGIMILVFGSFLLSGERPLEEFGFGLAFSVLVDALIIRGLLVPALMHLIGPANWSMPAWLDRRLPQVDIETAEDGSAVSNGRGAAGAKRELVSAP